MLLLWRRAGRCLRRRCKEAEIYGRWDGGRRLWYTLGAFGLVRVENIRVYLDECQVDGQGLNGYARFEDQFFAYS